MIERWLSDKRLHIVLFLLSYVLLCFEYVNFVYAKFAFMNFVLQYDYLTISIGFLLLILVVGQLFHVQCDSGQTYVINQFVALFFCVPAIIMYQFGGITPAIPVYTLLFQFLLSSLTLQNPIGSRRFVVKHPVLILTILAIVMLVPFIVTYGLRINPKVFTLGSEIYDVRAQATANGNLLTAYLFGPLTKFALPILIVFGFIQKKTWAIVAGIVAMLYVFVINPHKALFFSIFLVILFYFFRNYTAKAGLMLTGTVGIIVITMLVSLVTGNILMESIFVRRLFFVPVQICDSYFTFFNNDYIYLSHSVLNHCIDYPYSYEPAFLMGDIMHNRPQTSCNTGIIGDGYMNFGHLGVLISILCATFIVKFIESMNIHHAFFGIVIVMMFLFLNGAFLTSLLTHGIIFFLLVAVFLLKDTQQTELES